MENINPLDKRFVLDTPDPDFSPEHNQAVIDETIRKTDENYRKKDRDFDQTLKDRAWYVGHYIKGLKSGKAPTDPNKYFSKKDLAYMKGEFILEKLKERRELLSRSQAVK